MWLLLQGALLAVLFGSWWATGRGLARRLGIASPLAPWVLGPATTVVLVFVASSLGIVPREPAAVGLVVVPALALAPAAILRLREGAAVAGRPSPAALAALVLVAVMLAPVLLLAATPTVSQDADVYHLALPRLYLEHGGFRPVEMNVYSNWPLGAELLFLPALAVGGPSLAKLVHAGFGLLVLRALWVGVGAGTRAAPGILALLVWAIHPVVLFEHRVAHVELVHAWWLLAAFLLLERARETPRERGAVVLAGVAAGMLAGVKLTGLLHAGLVGLVALPGVVRTRGRRAVAEFAVPVGLLALPWAVRAFVLTGNPVYPFAGGVFPTPDWSPRLAERLASWQAEIGPGRELVDLLLLPIRVFVAGGRGYEAFDGRLAAVGVVLVPLGLAGLLLVRNHRLGGRARRAAVLAGLLFVLWAAVSQQMRLLVPALAPLALAVGLGLAAGAERIGPRITVRPRDREDEPSSPDERDRNERVGLGAALAVVMLGVIALAGFLTENRATLAAGWRAAVPLGTLAPERIRASGVPLHWRAVGERVDADDRLLLLATNGRFHSPVDVLADSFFEASQIAEWLEGADTVPGLVSRVRERGVTHLLADRRPLPMAWPPAVVELLARPELLPVVWRSPDGRWVLWSVVGEGGAVPGTAVPGGPE